MTGLAARAYNKVSVDTGVAANDPHALVLMLFDGALSAARLGLGHMQAGRIADKAAALSKATRIVDEGLKISLDKSAGGQLAQRLGELYEYVTMRLLQANLRNDATALSEVIKLLEDLRAAWAQIRKPASVQPATPASASAASPAGAASTTSAAAAALRSAAPATAAAAPSAAPTAGSRFLEGLVPLPARRFATSA